MRGLTAAKSLQRGISVLAIAGALLGVVPSGCATVATHDEYASYRGVRQARERNDRLAALERYATNYPGGLWIEEVRAERAQHEEAIWTEGNSTREGLQFYLSVYPDGSHVEAAQQRLAALGTVQERREVEQEHVEEVQQEQRAVAAEERRLWVTRAVTFWTRTLLGIRNFGQPISAVARANPDFSQAFGQAPAPVCNPQGCLKHYHASYVIPVPGATRIDREMHVFLRLHLDRGRVQRVEVLLPNKGFSRWYELENRTLVTDEDPSQRMAAIEWAMQRLEPVIAEVATGARAIDVVPEPIAPISQAAQAASTRAEESDTEVPGQPQPAQPQQQAPQAGGEQPAADGSIDQLLEQAVGGGAQGEQPQALPEEPPPDTSALVLPIGLRGLQRGNVRMVVFAAGDEDYAEAYDGFYIELARD
ncbi:hypothetical protein DB32_004051 [Sandaracinus amylolyticus]|uniref:Uncharacterized protein n=1 Tax=Sandaracinus amylolyticus TaxID=927083 RepID=A0A0F6W494_9BACT|nr:hypothetical protein DB32_004051 [Sandaracinus amylolyticus]